MYTPEKTLTALDFLDFAQGLKYCANSMDLYLDAINGYVGADSRYSELTVHFEAKDWDQYRVCIHAVKSSSLIIGISGLFEKAKLLETAVKESNYSYIEKYHPPFMKEYERIISMLSKALKTSGY